MAKFKDLSLDLETGEHIDFDDADTIQMGYDGSELYINSTISGIRAAQLHHMVRYDQLTETSGILQGQINSSNEFIELTDTPTTYSGYGNYSVSVKDDETGLEFTIASGVGRAGQYDIADATDYFTVTFAEPLDTTTYYLVGSIENQLDGEPAKYGFNISNTTVSGFDIELSDITDSANYKFNYTAVDSNIEAVGIAIPGPPGDQGDQGDQGIQGETGEQGITTASGQAGQYDIANTTESFTINFLEDMTDLNYYVVGTIENQDDVETSKYGFNITGTTLSGFDVDLSDITDSDNYKFNWLVVDTAVEAVGVPVPGPQGEQGVQGDQGIQGIQGIQGDTGAQGIQGIQGETGASGIQGDTGAQGIQGETGVSGVQGEQGIQGIQGETGASGVSGDHGLLTGLTDDDHIQYVPTDASRGFTSTVSGIDPTEDYHLATKSYIDDKDFLKLPASPAVNQTANGFIVSMTVDVNSQGFGTPLYMASDGNLEDANASSNTTMPCVAMALETGTGEKECCLLGFVRNDSWNWTSLGGVEGLIYVSTTSGILTQTLVSGSGQQVQVVGYATHADRMYFNPQLPMVELA